MKIKNFYAGNISQAMQDIRDTLGDDAVIISTQSTENGGVKVIAAIEAEPEFAVTDKDEVKVFSRYNFDDTNIKDSLNYHGTLDIVRDRILANIGRTSEAKHIFDDKKLLEDTFSRIFIYKNILDTSSGNLKIFMGSPGSGKSTAIAKLATKIKMQGMTSFIISTDNVRAGANKQLEAFADILEVGFKFVKGGKALFNLINKSKDLYDFILIDTPGINPYLDEDIDKIREISEALKGDKIMTIDAGRNTFEAVEIAGIFKELGANIFLPTRLDLTKRIGGVLSIASCCGLGFCAASVSSRIAGGLADIDHRSLAKLIMS